MCGWERKCESHKGQFYHTGVSYSQTKPQTLVIQKMQVLWWLQCTVKPYNNPSNCLLTVCKRRQVRATLRLHICAREMPSSYPRQVIREDLSGVSTAFLGPSRYTPKLIPWKMQHRICLNPSLIIIGGIFPPHLTLSLSNVFLNFSTPCM
jgi:hypothetical protein